MIIKAGYFTLPFFVYTLVYIERYFERKNPEDKSGFRGQNSISFISQGIQTQNTPFCYKNIRFSMLNYC